jgi:hypothetical protein
MIVYNLAGLKRRQMATFAKASNSFCLGLVSYES